MKVLLVTAVEERRRGVEQEIVRQAPEADLHHYHPTLVPVEQAFTYDVVLSDPEVEVPGHFDDPVLIVLSGDDLADVREAVARAKAHGKKE